MQPTAYSSMGSVNPGYTPIQKVLFMTTSVLLEAAADAVLRVAHVRLARQVAGKQQPRAHLLLVEVSQQVDVAVPAHRA
jgi:hypothetical protein